MDNRTYKRSWKNLLINKRYQLRFTLFMVGLCSVLMIALGWWVMKVATETTQVAYNQLLADVCKDPKLFADPDKPQDAVTPPEQQMGAPMMQPTPEPAPAMDPTPAPSGAAAPSGSPAAPAPAPAVGSAASAAGTPAPTDVAATPAPTGSAATPAGSATPPAAAGSASKPAPAAGSGSATPSVEDEEAAAARRRAAIRNSIKSEMTMLQPSVSKHFGKQVIEKWTCKYRTKAAKHRLETGRNRILYVLIFVGIALVLFLAGYGIKMTHKVAGPLFKVGLYHAKMREGRFDKVYNLRKGDQLVNFYEHFKTAHAGVVKAEQAEIKQLKAVIAAAEAAGAGDAPAVVELRELVARKEKALA